ncbi:MAG: YcxB family protein [Treponema sp.]|nr:YcxB family protein [Treponema sp.]
MTIKCSIDKTIFKRFTVFDILKRRKYWRSPVIFAAILCFSSVICYIMHNVDGAVMLGTVLLIVALGIPIVYFGSFFHSLTKQIQLLNLSEPKVYYTLDLTESIHVSNEKEKAKYEWDQTYHAYKDTHCIYLYITPQRAFLLPDTGMTTESFDAVWSFIVTKIGEAKCKVL